MNMNPATTLGTSITRDMRTITTSTLHTLLMFVAVTEHSTNQCLHGDLHTPRFTKPSILPLHPTLRIPRDWQHFPRVKQAGSLLILGWTQDICSMLLGRVLSILTFKIPSLIHIERLTHFLFLLVVSHRLPIWKPQLEISWVSRELFQISPQLSRVYLTVSIITRELSLG